MTQLLKEVIAARMADEERILNQVFSKNENKEKFEKNELEIPWRLHLCTNGSACVVRHVPEKRPTCVSSIPTPSHNPWRCTRVAQGPGSCPAGWQPQLLGLAPRLWEKWAIVRLTGAVTSPLAGQHTVTCPSTAPSCPPAKNRFSSQASPGTRASPAGPGPEACCSTMCAPEEPEQPWSCHLHISSRIPLFFCCDGGVRGFLPHHHARPHVHFRRALCLATKVEEPELFTLL